MNSETETLIVSVGGSPEPVLHSIRHHQPKLVVYFCSDGSREKAEAIHKQLASLEHSVDRDFVEVTAFEDLNACYRALRTEIPAVLRKWRCSPEGCVIDYTGGTKTMSAALVLAAGEWAGRFSYIGGQQRDRGGLGITVDGREKVHYHSNPWDTLAVRELERAIPLWDQQYYHSVATLLHAASEKGGNCSLRVEAVARLAEALEHRHALQFKQAERLLNRLSGDLPKLFEGRDADILLTFQQKLLHRVRACNVKCTDEALLAEVIDQAIRCQHQRRYADAAARIYRAIEMRLQIWLEDTTDGAFVNGKLAKGRERPESMRDWTECPPVDREGEIKLALEDLIRALHYLHHPGVTEIAENLAREGNASQLRKQTQIRNHSILAHGTTPISEDTVDTFFRFAATSLGLITDQPSIPQPALRVQWF